MPDDGAPLMTVCPSCGLHKHVSPMVVLWGKSQEDPCPECKATGFVTVCPVCNGDGGRENDPGEASPPVGRHKCRTCRGWGTLEEPPTTARELGIPPDLPWLLTVDDHGRAGILHFLYCDLSQKQYLFARAVRMGLIDPRYATILAPGWENNTPEEDDASARAAVILAGPAAPAARAGLFRRLLAALRG